MSAVEAVAPLDLPEGVPGMRDRLREWKKIQGEIADCPKCLERWPGQVVQPLRAGEIPDPPGQIKILFVGVAPTPMEGRNQGRHFYSSQTDPLRTGLFKALDGLLGTDLVNANRTSKDAGDAAFHAQHFFFVHASKVRPVKTSAPPRRAIRLCTDQHLRAEIALLAPEGICFLGATNAAPAAKVLFGEKVARTPVRRFLEGWEGWVVVAPQPVRAGKAGTPAILRPLWGELSRNDPPLPVL